MLWEPRKSTFLRHSSADFLFWGSGDGREKERERERERREERGYKKTGRKAKGGIAGAGM
jgi:hypothetical protein